jgi:hypothetical protein
MFFLRASLWLLMAGLGMQVQAQQTLCINEMLAANSSGIQDEDGDYEDWIELFNAGATPIDLSDYYLSDKEEEPLLWSFPSVVLNPGEFLLVFASGKDRTQGPWLHTNFKISADGEHLLLSHPDGYLVDAYLPVSLAPNQSYGRIVDGATALTVFAEPSPGASNNGQEVVVPSEELLSFSHHTGFYTQPFELHITCTEPEAVIHYTLNGMNPGPDDPVYGEAVLLDSQNAVPATLSHIPTNPEDIAWSWRWRKPSGFIQTGIVLKAQAFRYGVPISPVQAHTYWVNPAGRARYSLPVISLVIEPDDFFDYERGIYVPGKTHDDHPVWNWVWGTGNYFHTGIEYERPASFSLLDTSGNMALHQNLGVRIAGSGSRALAMKSLRLYPRSEYGESSLNYPFFEELQGVEFKRLLLRNGGQEFVRSHFLDGFTHQLVAHLDLEFQYYQPAIVFLNGEYWGLHNIRERIDKHYLAYRRGVDPDNIDLINNQEADEGDLVEYNALLHFLGTSNLNTPEAYQHIDSLVDLPNYYNYMAAKIYIGVYDWPGNNIRFWRERTPGSKWRWIFFDNDYAMENPEFNAIEHATMTGGTNWPNPDWSTFFLRKLLENNRIRQEFLDAFAFHIEHTFEPERAWAMLHDAYNIVKPEMTEHLRRWGFPSSMNRWYENMEEISRFIWQRPCIMRRHLINYFGLLEDAYLPDLCREETPDFTEPVLTNHTLFPNPNDGQFTLSFNFPGVWMEKCELRIYNALGQQVYSDITLLKPGSNVWPVSLETKQAAGVYVLQLQSAATLATVRFVVQ